VPEASYPGAQALEVMKLASLYNGAIHSWLADGARGARRILDFGAGSGEFCNRFSSRDIVAVEPDKTLASSIVVRTVGNLESVQGPFDFVFTINVLEHIEADVGVLSRLRALMGNGGRLFAFVPAFPSLYSDMDREVGHVRRYTQRGLVEAVTEAGFEVTSCRYFDSLGFFCTMAFMLYRHLRRQSPKTATFRSITIYDKCIFPLSLIIDLVTSGKLLGKNLMLEAYRKG